LYTCVWIHVHNSDPLDPATQENRIRIRNPADDNLVVVLQVTILQKETGQEIVVGVVPSLEAGGPEARGLIAALTGRLLSCSWECLRRCFMSFCSIVDPYIQYTDPDSVLLAINRSGYESVSRLFNDIKTTFWCVFKKPFVYIIFLLIRKEFLQER